MKKLGYLFIITLCSHAAPFLPINCMQRLGHYTQRLSGDLRHLAGLQAVLGKRFPNYDPSPALVTDNRKNIIKKRPCFFLHSFNNNHAQVFKFYNNQCMAGDAIIFDFPDAAQTGKSDLRKTCFSQENDVFAAIYSLKLAHDAGVFKNEIDVFSFSRGAGVAGNMIHVLAKPTRAQEKKLLEIGIDEKKRHDLLQAIQHGTVILDRPLVHLRACLQALGKYHANKFLENPRQTLYKTSLCQYLQYLENNSLVTATTKGLFFSLALLVNYTSMGLVTRFNYSPFGLNLWDSSTTLRDLGIKTLLHFQHHDEVVSNEYDISLYEKIAQGNPEHTYVIFGDNGGHHCEPYDLIPYAHTFRMKYGGSYNADLVMHTEALTTLCHPVTLKHEPFIEKLKLLTGKK